MTNMSVLNHVSIIRGRHRRHCLHRRRRLPVTLVARRTEEIKKGNQSPEASRL